MKVSQLKIDVITPLSSSEIFSSCSAASGNVADIEISDCSFVLCILNSLGEQREIVSDIQPSVGTQPGNDIAISGQEELNEHASCDSSEDRASKDALRRSETEKVQGEE